MTDQTTPRCTGRCAGAGTITDLPCGCQDVHYVDGTDCYEHNHIQCDGQDYAAAHAEFDSSGEARVWDTTVGDGISGRPRAT